MTTPDVPKSFENGWHSYAQREWAVKYGIQKKIISQDNFNEIDKRTDFTTLIERRYPMGYWGIPEDKDDDSMPFNEFDKKVKAIRESYPRLVYWYSNYLRSFYPLPEEADRELVSGKQMFYILMGENKLKENRYWRGVPAVEREKFLEIMEYFVKLPDEKKDALREIYDGNDMDKYTPTIEYFRKKYPIPPITTNPQI